MKTTTLSAELVDKKPNGANKKEPTAKTTTLAP